MNETIIICVFLSALAEIIVAGIIAGIIALIRRRRTLNNSIIYFYGEHAEIKHQYKNKKRRTPQ